MTLPSFLVGLDRRLAFCWTGFFALSLRAAFRAYTSKGFTVILTTP
jgi:hypothetical protein